MTLLGVLIQAFGLSWLIEVAFGTDPFSAFMQGVIVHVPLSFGTAELIVNALLVIVVFLTDTEMIGYGTIANMVLIGYISDFCRYLYGILLPEGFFDRMVVRAVILLPALAVFIFGAAMYMTAGLGASPYDAMSFILSKRIQKLPFQYIRIIYDSLFLILGWILGGNVGVVTFAVAFFLGPVIAWEQRKLSRFITEA